MEPRRQHCPICENEVLPMGRYPNYLCESCAEEATDKHGQPVYFTNVDISGGLIGFVRDPHTEEFVESKELTATPEILVRGIECYAPEAKFGGIVIRPTRKT